MPKTITLDEIKEVSSEFFDKYNYVAGQLPKETSAEDVLKIMQSLAGLVMKKRKENKPDIGFGAAE